MRNHTSSSDAKGVIHILNENLCDEYVLYTKTRACHWNVTGPAFAALHGFFQTQYEELDAIVDEVAERVRAVGGWARGTLEELKGGSKLNESPGRVADASGMIAELADDHDAVIRRLKADVSTCERKYQYAGTASFLAELIVRHEKMAWMLRAHLGAPSRESAGAGRGVNLMEDPGGSGE